MEQTILDYLVHELSPIDRTQLCSELSRLGTVSDSVPTEPHERWSDAIDRLVGEERLSASGGCVAIDRDAIANNTSQAQIKTQGMLF